MNSSLPINNEYESSDGVFNYKSFQLEADAAGEYYAGFWILPARHADKSLTTFTVFVNGNSIGTITPTEGNWQYATLDDDATIGLAVGNNIISIATTAPEIPEVECVRVADNREDAVISSEEYDNFLTDAIAGYDTAVTEQEPAITYAAGSTPEFHWDMELRYTFYKKMLFSKDEDVFITSSSDKPHIIDVMYCGEYRYPDPEPAVPIYPINPNGTDIGIAQPLLKKFFYATSEEMQGLNWGNRSEKLSGSKSQVATVKIPSIPKEGVYLIRIRTLDNSIQGVVDIHIDNDYFYEDSPISLSYIETSMPADGVEYASMTKSVNPDTDNAMIFIHGNIGDRVVRWNDDGSSARIRENNLDRHDAYISQIYRVNTSGISVSSASSSRPVSRCHVITRMASREQPVSVTDKIIGGQENSSCRRSKSAVGRHQDRRFRQSG